MCVIYSLFFILYSLFFILYSLFFILYSVFVFALYSCILFLFLIFYFLFLLSYSVLIPILSFPLPLLSKNKQSCPLPPFGIPSFVARSFLFLSLIVPTFEGGEKWRMIAVFFFFFFFFENCQKIFYGLLLPPTLSLGSTFLLCIPSLSFSSFPFLIISKENHLAPQHHPPPPSPPHTTKVVSWSFLLLLPLFHQKEDGREVVYLGFGVVPHPVWFLSCVFLKRHQVFICVSFFPFFPLSFPSFFLSLPFLSLFLILPSSFFP